MAAEEQKTQEAPAAPEKQTNCLSCNKPLKKLTQYYRNGKHYCSKRCWLNSKKPKEQQEG